MLDAVDGLDALQHVFNGVVDRVFPGFQGKPLMTHILQSDDFLSDVLLAQFFSGDGLVLGMVRTVDAAVDAIIGKVQGSEHDDPIAVVLLLDFLGQFLYLAVLLRQIAFQQHGSFPVGQTFAVSGTLDQRVDQLSIALVFLGIGQGVQDFLVIDEFLCLC